MNRTNVTATFRNAGLSNRPSAKSGIVYAPNRRSGPAMNRRRNR